MGRQSTQVHPHPHLPNEVLDSRKLPLGDVELGRHSRAANREFSAFR